MVLAPYHPDLPEIRHCQANYYDYMTLMDQKVGQLLRELENTGLLEETIVFYYADNGGVMPRSKRFLYDSGTHVPMIVRFPRKFQHLAPAAPGSRLDELVQFVDLAPTVLSLAGIPKPSYMQGRAFLGRFRQPEPKFVFGYRDRMDERYDLMRSVRSKRFLYIRNYLPDRIYGQHIWYLWKSPATRAWQKAFQQGRCNQVQSRFWQPKPSEELYDVQNDPHNIHNLADDPAYAAVLKEMRQALRQWMRGNRDAGFLPEGWMAEQSKTQTVYHLTHQPDFPFETIIETAEKASERAADNLGLLQERLQHKHPVVRYWAAVGCRLVEQQTPEVQHGLKNLLNDSVADVRLAAAEALCQKGDCPEGLNVLVNLLYDKNPKVQLAALNALDALGTKVKPVLKKLMALQPWHPQTDPYFHRAYVEIIKRLKPGWEDYLVW